MNPRLLLTALALTTTLLAGAAAPAAPAPVTAASRTAPVGRAAHKAPRFHEYVALGDSWSADVTFLGIDHTYAPVGCAQSSWNYPKQVAARLGVAAFRDATCGGATTAEMTAPQNVGQALLLSQGVNPAQFDRLTPTTDLVTVGIGGNDAGLEGVVLGCINPLPAPLAGPCRTRFARPGDRDLMSQQIAATKSRITGVLEGIHERSPHATVLVVDYLAGVATDRGCYPRVPILDEDLTWFGARLKELNAMLASAAAEGGARFVDTYRGSLGHDICKAADTRWVEGFTPVSSNPPGPAVPFHPNRLGADHQAATVLAELGS
ncbi:SGNH/GDSL hydrolase family protein [Streptomyces sp. WM6378]|uniref:SGNH/GDSL hydrolase family protein n=1 Tax=Streptomyces sp. WM6378 TaxID=1415557 RepID=UPI0006AFAA15|nr:SGNH/GDSL hydrolase family protein [Streptomyces sp. WM6378]